MKKTLLLLALAAILFSCEESESVKPNISDILVAKEWIVKGITVNGVVQDEDIVKIIWSNSYIFDINNKIWVIEDTELKLIGQFNNDIIDWYGNIYKVMPDYDNDSFSMIWYNENTDQNIRFYFSSIK